MVENVYAVLFGAVQGLTEFLPVSSSGHLVLFHSITDFRVGNELAFDVALHLGTLLALLVFFWHDLINLVRAGWRSVVMRRIGDDQQKLFWLLAVATVPGAIGGVLLETLAESTFRSDRLVAVMLILAGGALWWIDRIRPRDRSIGHLGWLSAIVIGLGQALALIPGVSRSGATMTMARWFRLDRESAARFSFLLATPIMLGAGAKKILDVTQTSVTNEQVRAYVIGGITAAGVGYLAIRFMLQFISRHSYGIFALYRLVLGLVVLLLLR